MYVRSLCHRYAGYGQTSTQQLLAHLYATYANISPTDLQANEAKLRAPYDANHPVENLFYQVENAVEYVAAGNTPYSPEQVVTISFQLVFQTSLFLDDCKTWKRLPATSKSWATFKTFFAPAHQEWRESQVTTAGAEFQSANHLYQHKNQSANHVYQQETVDAIDTLATATTSDCASVAALTSTNITLTVKVSASHAKLVVALQDNAKLANTMVDLHRKGGIISPSSCHSNITNYCWTCGYRSNHSSWKCPTPAPGHKKSATKADIMQGSETNKGTRSGEGATTSRISSLNNMYSPILVPTNSPTNNNIAIVDPGCTSQFLGPTMPCTHKVPMTHGLPVGLPNGDTMRASHMALPPFTQLSLAARQAYIFPPLRNKVLLSIVQLCNVGFLVVFDQHHVTAFKANHLSISWNRDPKNGLCYIDLPPNLSPPRTRTVAPSRPPTVSTHIKAHSAYGMTMQADLVQFMHRAAFSPIASTWNQAIDAGYFATWTGLTSALVRKYLPKSLATSKGHMRQDRKNIRSKKTALSPTTNLAPDPVETQIRSHRVFLKTTELTEKISMNQTGRFPMTSSCYRKYIMVLFDHDINVILVEPLK